MRDKIATIIPLIIRILCTLYDLFHNSDELRQIREERSVTRGDDAAKRPICLKMWSEVLCKPDENFECKVGILSKVSVMRAFRSMSQNGQHRT